jgi:hypothetical protein
MDIHVRQMARGLPDSHAAVITGISAVHVSAGMQGFLLLRLSGFLKQRFATGVTLCLTGKSTVPSHSNRRLNRDTTFCSALSI